MNVLLLLEYNNNMLFSDQSLCSSLDLYLNEECYV